MLPPKENELITRVGQGTPMGDTMRRYWIPACLASEIAEPDSPPVRVRLLGEDLVAFRDSEGRIGLIDELCPHRRVSLFFGRNEECGLRCVYHGWKYDVEGNCVDQLNEPEEHQFKHHIHITAYPTVELGGLVWAYMGPPEKMPASPKFAWTQVPESRRHVSKVIESTSPITAISMPASGRSAIRTCTSAPIISSCHSIRSGRRARNRGCRWTPATSGSRWMTRTAWSTTGCTARLMRH